MHQALYRRYRPRTFDSLLGQDHITRILKNQINNDNIGHAYLFSGTRGTGKTSAAKIFSRAVNCLEPRDGNPCNKCENCLEILEDRTMDVIEMDAASYNSVDDIRDLRDKVVYLPAKIKYKVYIIDEVHMLSKGAFNALLKTLEEPPKHLIFILATTEPEKLPQTILSRCQRFDYRRISNKDIVLNMRNILEDLGVEAEEEALRVIARNCDGAMRDALSLLDQCVAFNDKKISYEDTINILGIANKALVFDTVNHIREKDIEKVLETIDELLQAGKSAPQFMKDLISHFRDLMIVKSSRNPENLRELDEVDAYREQTSKMDMAYILRALDILTQAEAQGKWASQPRIILEMAAIKLVNLGDELNLEERIKRLEEGYVAKPAGGGQSSTSPANHKGTVRTSPARAEISKKPQEEKRAETQEIPVEIIDDGRELTLEIIEREWANVLKEIKVKGVRLYAFAIEGEVLSYADNLLTIGYKEGFGFHHQAISAPERKELVEKIVSNYFKKNIKINFITGNLRPKEEPKKEDKEKDIKEVVDFFGEDLVEIK